MRDRARVRRNCHCAYSGPWQIHLNSSSSALRLTPRLCNGLELGACPEPADTDHDADRRGTLRSLPDLNPPLALVQHVAPEFVDLPLQVGGQPRSLAPVTDNPLRASSTDLVWMVE